jgi:hypothetical protein
MTARLHSTMHTHSVVPVAEQAQIVHDSSQVKRDLIYSVSHEFQAKGMLCYLEKCGENVKREKLVQIICASIRKCWNCSRTTLHSKHY